jgi:hypothetical protein
MPAGIEWLEARSTIGGVLTGLPGSPAAPDSPRFEGILSLVTTDGEDADTARSPQPRRLPTLYFGKAPVFADRSIDKVAARLLRIAEITVHAWERPTYLLQPCALGSRVGLYARELLNRSAYRSKLSRRGLEFSDDPYVNFTDASRFSCKDWGEFDPSFVIVRGFDADPDKVLSLSHARLAFRLATFRMGPIDPSELKRLVAMCSRPESAGAKNPEAVLAKLSRGA